MQSGVSWGVEWVFNLVPDVVYFYFTHQGDSRCLHKHMLIGAIIRVYIHRLTQTSPIYQLNKCASGV